MSDSCIAHSILGTCRARASSSYFLTVEAVLASRTYVWIQATLFVLLEMGVGFVLLFSFVSYKRICVMYKFVLIRNWYFKMNTAIAHTKVL